MTVSRVLNGHPSIKESTRDKVLLAVEQLGTSATSPPAPSPCSAPCASGGGGDRGGVRSGERPAAIHRSARRRGYSVSSIALDEDDSADPGRALQQLLALGIDALCLVMPRSASVAAVRAASLDVPVLVVKTRTGGGAAAGLRGSAAGITMAVDHLAALGHRDALYVSGPMDWLDARARERAFRARTRSWGMTERPMIAGDWSADFGYDFAVSLERLPEYTAIVAANDEVALGSCTACTIAVCGSRTISASSASTTLPSPGTPSSADHGAPALRDARHDRRGRLAGGRRGPRDPQRTKIPPELIVRLSTAKARTAP